MRRATRLYAQDVLDRIERLRAFANIDIHALPPLSDQRAILERNLEVLSEASRNLPVELKQAHPQVNWRGVADIGNALRHGYHNLRDSTLEEVVRLHLEPLAAAVTDMLETLDE